MKKIFCLLFVAIILTSCNTQKDNNDPGSTKSKNMHALVSETENSVTYLSGRDSIKAYFALPKGNEPFPALIILHEHWGLSQWIRTNADAFANKGYAALAIDLYRGQKTNQYDEAQALSLALNADQVNRDLKAAFDYLEKNPMIDKERIGVIGWGMGGMYALQSASSLRRLKAVISVYGRLTYERKTIRKINCPLLAIFGETDRGIPLIEIQNFEQTLNDLKKENKIIIYRNVGHAFMNPESKETYNRDITERATREIFAFIEKHLGKKG